MEGSQMAKTLMLYFSLTLIAVNVTVTAKAADPALVLYFPLDEGQGDIVKDLSQNGNNGELEDSPKWVEGKFGKALEFGEGSRVHIPASDSLHCDILKDEFTLTAWVKPTLTGDQWQQVWRSIDENDSSPHTLFVNTGGFFSWRGRAGGQWAERCVTPGGMVKADEWTHVAVIGDKKDFRIYINGEEAGTAPFVELDGGMAEFYLGFDGRQWNERFSGIIDEFCILTRALTADEVKAGAETMMQLLSVRSAGKLAATWGHIRRNQ